MLRIITASPAWKINSAVSSIDLCADELCPFEKLLTRSQCIASVRFLTQSQSCICMITQSQSANVYFICPISFFLHSRSLRLCISSVRFPLLLSSVNISLTYLGHDLTDFNQT